MGLSCKWVPTAGTYTLSPGLFVVTLAFISSGAFWKLKCISIEFNFYWRQLEIITRSAFSKHLTNAPLWKQAPWRFLPSSVPYLPRLLPEGPSCPLRTSFPLLLFFPINPSELLLKHMTQPEFKKITFWVVQKFRLSRTAVNTPGTLPWQTIRTAWRKHFFLTFI